MNSYELSRGWFNFCFEHPDLITPTHTAIFFFAVEHCNRLGWKKKFGFPSGMAKDAIGVKSYKTYIKAFNEVVSWGFITLVQKSENQYSANIISLNSAPVKFTESLDRAMIKHDNKCSNLPF